MAEREIVATVQRYLGELVRAGIPVAYGVLFGSHARGVARSESDIDVLVISPLFDERRKPADLDTLWHVARRVDVRIEPIGAGVAQYAREEWRPLFIMARREGVVVYPEGSATSTLAADAQASYQTGVP